MQFQDNFRSSRNTPPAFVKTSIILYGFIAIIAQIVLLRELTALFYGNELTMGMFLGAWLFWTSVGSGFLARFVRLLSQKYRFFVNALMVWAIGFILTLFVCRISFFATGISIGEITGFLPIFVIPFVALAPFCLLSGFLYALACSLYSETIEASAHAIGSVYWLEAIGAGLGGGVSSFLLLRFLTPFQIAFIMFCLGLCNYALHSFIWYEWSRGRRALRIFLAIIAAAITLVGSSKLAQLSLRLHWRELNLQQLKYSIYGSIALTKLEDSFSVYENGLLMFTIPDLFYAEESVHLALLEHPQPKTFLMIGGGIGGGLHEALKHPTVKSLDYVELDPAMLQVIDARLPEELRTALADPRVRVHHIDGRLYVKLSHQKYDVVIINLPDPHTTLLNRFYTVEFFREVSQILNRGGICAFSVTSSENVVSDDLARFLSCLFHTLKATFPDIVLIPGNTCHFIACTAEHVLTENPDILISRLKTRNLDTQFIREYYLPYRMSVDRTQYIRSRILPIEQVALNTDFKPVAYYFDMVLWGSALSPGFRDGFIALSKSGFKTSLTLLLVLALVSLAFRFVPHARSIRYRWGIALSIFTVGYSELGMEIILIIAFQALYGYAYYQLALMVTGYMLGLTIGSWASIRGRYAAKNPLTAFRYCQAMMAIFPIAAIGLLQLLAHHLTQLGSTIMMQLIFMMLISIAGFIGGYQFPIANRLYFESEASIAHVAGTIYGLDLAGSCLGAILTSAIFIPLFGIEMTLLSFSGVNFIALASITSQSNPG
ncbi:fused MFS/spermidine synthase [candidate division KSB1 bacterium]|nr:fused MFS/spermidine synthase [candidate division KSB1 bacterium]